MQMSSVLKALHDIKTILHDPGDWIQGTSYQARPSGRGRFCVAGAIMAVADDLILRAQLCDRIGELVPNYGIPYWNDRPERTHADVIKLIEQAILNQEKYDHERNVTC